MTQKIEHSGIVSEIDHHCIRVVIVQQTSCEDCHAKGVCHTADNDKKIIEVETDSPEYRVGDKVVVFGKKSMGQQAVLLVFVIPFIIILFTLIILNLIVANDVYSGGIAILVLLPYYGILSLFNNKFKSKFRFDVRKED